MYLLNNHNNQRFQKQPIRIDLGMPSFAMNRGRGHRNQIDQPNQDNEQTVLWYHLIASVDFGLVTSILRMQPRLFNPELARFDLCPGLN
jgi:hypothetical protein